MCLEWLDSCSHMGTLYNPGTGWIPQINLSKKWTLNNSYYCNPTSPDSPGPVRRTNPAYALPAYALYAGSGNVFGSGGSKTLNYRADRFIGQAFYEPSTYPSNKVCLFLSGGTILAQIWIENDGTISVRNGNNNTIVWNSNPWVWTYNAYHYIEFYVNLTGTAPININFSVVVDGNPLVTGMSATSGVNAADLISGAATMNQIAIGGTNPAYSMDIIVYNTDATDVNGNATTIDSFLGDVAIMALVPNADVLTAWSLFGSGSSRFATLANDPPQDDVEYIYDSTVGDIDSVYITPISGLTGVLQCAQLCIYGKKNAEGTRAIRGQLDSTDLYNLFNVGGTPVLDQYLADYYDYSTFPLDSKLGTPWTEANFNSSSFGVKVSI